MNSIPEVTAIVVSGLNQLETAVRCMKLGAFDYFIKTDEEDRIVGGVLRAVRMLEMQRDYQEMSDRAPRENCCIPRLCRPSSPATGSMLTVFSYVEAVARSPNRC